MRFTYAMVSICRRNGETESVSRNEFGITMNQTICPSCSRPLQYNPEQDGQQVSCPSCHATLLLPQHQGIPHQPDHQTPPASPPIQEQEGLAEAKSSICSNGFFTGLLSMLLFGPATAVFYGAISILFNIQSVSSIGIVAVVFTAPACAVCDSPRLVDTRF